MAADYAGAIAAIRQRFVDNWTTTPIAYVNEAAQPAIDASGNPTTWVLFEIVNMNSQHRKLRYAAKQQHRLLTA
jgi:hypothetical protein